MTKREQECVERNRKRGSKGDLQSVSMLVLIINTTISSSNKTIVWKLRAAYYKRPRMKETWTVDYRAAFERFKLEILNSFTLYHPDYSLKWILKTDASDFAVGGVLVQVFILPDGTEQYQVIAFVSMKLSAQAQNWSTIEKECFGIFYSVKKISYYLFGKRFTLQTDHSNLLWMQKSEVAKIIRQRIYLQNYDFVLQHTPTDDAGNTDQEYEHRVRERPIVKMIESLIIIPYLPANNVA